PERECDPADGQQEPGPRSRDHVQAGAERKARARSGNRAIHRRRYRPRRLWDRHQRLGSTVIGGSALWMAADKVITKGRRIAAHLLEAAEPDIEFADGNFSVAGTDRRIGITDVAKASFQAGRLTPGLEGGRYATRTIATADP